MITKNVFGKSLKYTQGLCEKVRGYNMKSMHHNGVMVPPKYEAKGLSVKIKGEWHELTPEEEERVVAWAAKIGTPYVEDPVFAWNFHGDLSELMGREVKPDDIDYAPIHKMIVAERKRKKNLSREEKKKRREERKKIREANKEKYGWAIIDGERCELGNYMVEPSSIFMGRGQHPLRGKWKEGPTHEDIELNLSPDAEIPEGNWKDIIWDPESIWIARWRDKLSGKMKYVWPHDSSPIKQRKEIEKFNKAIELKENLEKIEKFIHNNLTHEDLKRRKTATVCYLINELNFRVGDEKDEEEEADTVGASSLRAEHIKINGDGTVTFDFLGKDSVRLVQTAKLDEKVIENLKEFMKDSDGNTLFDEVNSSVVSEFLDEVMEGITAKVFRTCHATEAVEEKLKEIELDPSAPEYVKKHVATIANLEAAVTCNHKKTISSSWQKSLERQKERLKERKERARNNVLKYKERILETNRRYEERIAKYEAKLIADKEKLEEYKKELEWREKEERATKGIKNRIRSKRRVIRNGRKRIRDTKAKHRERIAKLKERLENRKHKDKELIEKTKLRIEVKELTKDYNLNTSLKSYVDPRVFLDWGKKVNYDWRNYYSKTLEKKFSWIEPEPAEQEAQ
ncbi:DNA topoisomerase I [Candidatus Bathyarchaeota archaeon]|nr:DNA topoisomerase I [Candidatus Bathyarchaeota archaeon]